jgi:hypothetical protein
MLMISGMAVYMSILTTVKPNIDNPFTSPISLGIGPSLFLGIVLAVTLLWLNRYTAIALLFSLFLWFFLGCLICCSAAC